MKDREYYYVEVTMHNGGKFNNPLMLKEVHLIGTLARENKSVYVERRTMSAELYKLTFNV